jgi:RHS repeat-associated protein
VDRTGASTGTWRFGYDPAGNRQSEQAGGIPRSYDYDARNRLLGSVASGPMRIAGQTSEPATVSVNGRPARMLPGNTFETEVPAETAATGLSVSAQDPSTNVRTTVYQVPALAGPVTYTHDPNGNLTQKIEDGHTWTYEWDAENQLLHVTKDGTEAARFRYDPLGRRIQKVAGSVTTSYLYNRAEILRESRSDIGIFTYIHGLDIDEPLARRDTSSAVEYYHADALGSIVKMTDQAGAVVQTRQYDAWGDLEVGANQPGYAFTGREWDLETGLYYYRARYYGPRVGRFVSEDPIRFRGGIGFYAYVGNNPARGTDPMGSGDWALEMSWVDSLAYGPIG